MSWSTAFGLGGLTVAKLPKDDGLAAENAHLRDLLAQSGIDAQRIFAQAGVIASETEADARLQRLLLEELHHRSKNSLAVVMAITSQTLRNAATLEEGRTAVEGRLLALSRAQDMLLQVNCATARLSDVINTAIEPFEDREAPRFRVAATDVDIEAAAVMPITLSLNELCTNAVKYGALSISEGRVAIQATDVAKGQRLKLKWTESGGPVVQVPTRRSFGTKLVQILAEQIAGSVQMRYDAAGFTYELDVPARAFVAHGT